VHAITHTTLVLGSRQTIDVVDRAAVAATGAMVTTRRSGGGAVLLEPGNALWIDVFMSRDDVLWDDDVGRAAWWLGDAWARAIGADTEVHRGGMERSEWSDLVCFAGRGPGEVTLAPSAAGQHSPKLVGISQRRTADGALFQSVGFGRWDPVGILALLRLDPADRARATTDLAGVATGLPIPLEQAAAAVVKQVA
jgi:lipoate-protein ligase A